MIIHERHREKFFAQVRITPGCWWWEGAVWGKGYGRIVGPWGNTSAHVASYIIHNGSYDRNLVVRHRCDNRLCVNPFHLELGTHSDNIQDCISRGRLNPGKLYGESNAASVITLRDARQIKDLLKCGLFTQTAIAKFYGVSIGIVNRIKMGHTWAEA